jgi:uncharacterized protein with FMN-binding domain
VRRGTAGALAFACGVTLAAAYQSGERAGRPLGDHEQVHVGDSFLGAVVATPYGDVQVRAFVSGSRLRAVVPVRMTDRWSRSVTTSSRIAPILCDEALLAQSARIDTVSGASYTSRAFIASLQSALELARATATL